MDSYHRTSRGQDTRNGRECQFCRLADPEFSHRRTIDRLVQFERSDSAAAHLTEDGYVRHRIAELMKRVATMSPPIASTWIKKSA
jgi:hypothetical protein